MSASNDDPEPPNAFGSKPNGFVCRSRNHTTGCAFDSDALCLLAQRKRACIYEGNEVIFYEGNPCFGIHFVESGAVLVRKSPGHHAGPILRFHHPGDILGYRDVLADTRYSIMAVAVTTCRLGFVERAVVWELLGRTSCLASRFLCQSARELGETEDSLLACRLLSVRARIANVLLMFTDQFASADESGRIRLELPISRVDLAWMVGARPESVSRAIHQLDKDGVACFDRCNRRSIEIPDLDALLDEVEVSTALNSRAVMDPTAQPARLA